MKRTEWVNSPEGKAIVERSRQRAAERAARTAEVEERAEAIAHGELAQKQRLCQHLCPHCGIPLKPEEMP